MIKLLYIYHRKKVDVLKDFERKNGPNTTLYGFSFFSNDNLFESSYIDVSKGFYDHIDIFSSSIFKKFFGLGFKAGLIFSNLSLINKQDVVFCTADSSMLPLLLFRKVGLVKKNVRIYGASIGLINNIISNKLKIKIIKFLLEQAEKVFLYSSKESEIFKKALSLKNVEYIPFGVDTNYFCSQNKSYEDIIVSAGNDSERDYNTLVTSWRKFYKENNNFKLKILTSKKIKLKDVDGIEVINKFSINEVKNLYERMIFGVIPVKETVRSSGQIAVLSMLAMNKMVISNKKSPGILDFKECDCILDYDTEDADSLRDAIIFAVSNTKNSFCRDFVIKNHSSEFFYKKLKNFFSNNI